MGTLSVLTVPIMLVTHTVSVLTTGRQLPPLSSVLYRIISGRRSVLAA